MKPVIIGMLSVFLAIAGGAALAQEQEKALADAFQRGSLTSNIHQHAV